MHIYFKIHKYIHTHTHIGHIYIYTYLTHIEGQLKSTHGMNIALKPQCLSSGLDWYYIFCNTFKALEMEFPASPWHLMQLNT